MCEQSCFPYNTSRYHLVRLKNMQDNAPLHSPVGINRKISGPISTKKNKTSKGSACEGVRTENAGWHWEDLKKWEDIVEMYFLCIHIAPRVSTTISGRCREKPDSKFIRGSGGGKECWLPMRVIAMVLNIMTVLTEYKYKTVSFITSKVACGLNG